MAGVVTAELKSENEVSPLKWRLGFGWPPILGTAAGLAGAEMISGIVGWVSAALGLLFAAYAAGQYWKWNSAPWRRVHFPAMLAYAGIAGMETGRSKQEGREFSRSIACRDLATVFEGTDGAKIVDELEAEPGSYLPELFARRQEELVPGLEAEKVAKVVGGLRGLVLGPRHVIAKVVERRHGEAEAARYVLAMLKNEAS